MRDLDKALADIVAIRSQIAAGTAFRGYGPATMAATGAVALVTAILQFWLLGDPTSEPLGFFLGWFIAAALSGLMIGIEMRARSRRHHSGFADAMIHQAVEQFLVPFEQLLGSGGEVLVLAYALDLPGEGIDDQGVDARALHPCDGFCLVREIGWQPHRSLL